MPNFLKALIIIPVFAVLALGLYNLRAEKKQLESKLETLTATVSDLREENRYLKGEIEYFSRTENLVKELKSKFNYREEGEGIIIIVPNE